MVRTDGDKGADAAPVAEMSERVAEQISAADMEMIAPFHARIREGQRIVEEAVGGLRLLSGVLTRRYELGPHDVIEEDGTISRGKLLTDPLAPHVVDAPAAREEPAEASGG